MAVWIVVEIQLLRHIPLSPNVITINCNTLYKVEKHNAVCPMLLLKSFVKQYYYWKNVKIMFAFCVFCKKY